VLSSKKTVIGCLSIVAATAALTGSLALSGGGASASKLAGGASTVTSTGGVTVDPPPAPAAKAKSFPAKVDINGRKMIGQPADAPGHEENAYKAGEDVPVRCQAGSGGEIWDLTSDGWWVPDTYVKTGTDGYAPGIDRCDGDDGDGSQVHGRSNGPAGPTTGTREEKIQRVLDAATSQVGRGYDYSWGSGGKGGASYGVHHYPDGDPSQGDDYDRKGFDCSGLTLYAFWKGAGIDIGGSTVPQYEAGTKVSPDDLQPGDLVFWGEGDQPGSTSHVVLYLGDNKIIEAAPPRDGKSIHIRDLYGKDDWTTHAIRVI